MENETELTAKQELFVQGYLIHLNATKAAIHAGYSTKTAGAIGHENLNKPNISRRIDALINERNERTKVDQDYVVYMLRRNIDRAMQAEPIFDAEGNIDEYKYNGAVVNKALELLGKHVGMWRETVQHAHFDMNLRNLTDDELREVQEAADPVAAYAAINSRRERASQKEPPGGEG